MEITVEDKKRALVLLEALMDAHRDAGNIERAITLWVRIMEILGALPPQDLPEDQPLWRV